jgi:endoglucanase
MHRFQKIFLCLIFVCSILRVSAEVPFHKGVNLTGWFSSNNSKSIPFNRFSKNDFQNIKSLGCDVVRLPITLHGMTSGAPDYVVDTLFYFYLDQVIDWAEELNMNLVIDNHTIPDATNKSVETPLLKIWPQMARHYKDRSTSVFYEILNEPNTLLASDWAKIQAKVVDSIRAYDTIHTIIVTGADWGGISGLTALKKLSDPNLIYSFHFYDPFLFTHQGATWPNPPMGDLVGVPFPYDATRMPACPESLKGTWVQSSLANSYKTDGTVAKLKSTIDLAANYAKNNGVDIFCGEFGVYNLKSPDTDRVEWYKVVPGYLTEKGIPWTMWDYQGGFGLFNEGSNEVFEYDLNRPLAEGMGLTLPPVKEYTLKADSVPFNLYTDLVGNGIIQGGSGDLFASDAYDGNYGILLTDIAQYSNLEFRFKFAKDMSLLVAADYSIDFWMKADSPGSNVVLRFNDTKTADPNDHPWRMDYIINSNVAPFDGEWHHVSIPLKKFVDAGSWDNEAWWGSTKSFDWKAVDRFQIVAENMSLTGKKFWFDNIRIEGEPVTGVYEQSANEGFQAKAYPNPFNKETYIEYVLPKNANVNVSIYNMAGQRVATLVEGLFSQGNHRVTWTAGQNDVSIPANGVYFCKISSSGMTEVLKLVVNSY